MIARWGMVLIAAWIWQAQAQGIGTQQTLSPAQMVEKVRIQAARATNTLRLSDMALLAAADVFGREPAVEEIVLHRVLGRYAARIPGVRAMIVTDAAGMVQVDSYLYPARRLNLADRDYVRRVLANGNGPLYIGAPLIGRSSGLPFIPTARAIRDGEGAPVGVVAAILNPGGLFVAEEVCDTCFAVLLRPDRQIVARYPASVQMPAAGADLPVGGARSGLRRGMLNALEIETAWLVIDDYDLIMTLSRFVAPGAAAAD